MIVSFSTIDVYIQVNPNTFYREMYDGFTVYSTIQVTEATASTAPSDDISAQPVSPAGNNTLPPTVGSLN